MWLKILANFLLKNYSIFISKWMLLLEKKVEIRHFGKRILLLCYVEYLPIRIFFILDFLSVKHITERIAKANFFSLQSKAYLIFICCLTLLNFALRARMFLSIIWLSEISWDQSSGCKQNFWVQLIVGMNM